MIAAPLRGALRSRQIAVESGLGDIGQQIHAAADVVALGKIEGFRFNQHDNTFSCIECEAYATLSNISNATAAGHFEGPDFTRRETTRTTEIQGENGVLSQQ